MTFDVFKTIPERMNYARSKLYTALGDRESVEKRIRIPLWMDQAIAELRRFIPEYDSDAAFIRDVIVHGLHYWKEERPETRAYLEQVMSWAKISEIAARRKAHEDQVEAFRRLQQSDRSETHRRETRAAIEAAIAATIDPYYQDQFRTLLT